MGPIQVSLRHPRVSKISLVETGKAVTIEREEEEEDLKDLIAQIEAHDDEEENIFQAPSAIELPSYISPWKGTTKIPKDLEASKSASKLCFLWMTSGLTDRCWDGYQI